MSTATALPSGPARPHNGGVGRGRGLIQVGWVPQGDVDHREWVELGRYLGALGRGSQWWIGDWIRYGTAKWGERYTEAARITGYDNATLRDIVWVASQFDLPRRRDKLTFAHHRELAPLSPDEQDEWFERAITLRLSSKDLRVELRGLRHANSSQSDKEETPTGLVSPGGVVCPMCGHNVPLPEGR